MRRNDHFRVKSSSLYLMTIFLLLAILPACDDSQQNADEITDFIASGEYRGEYWPTRGWRHCRPDELGMNADSLRKVYQYSIQPELHTDAVVIVKDGYIVAEYYFGDFGQDDRHESYSVAKSFASALVGIAIDQGLIPNVDVPVHEYFSQWQSCDTDPRKKQVTLRHLLTMTSGLQWNEEDYYGDTGSNDVFRMAASPDFQDYVLAKPLVYHPGDHWYYSSGESMLLSGILQSASGMTAFRFARKYLFDPLGIEKIDWLSDPAGYTITGWGVQTTARNFAKFGYLYLNGGEWDDRQIVSREWVRQSTQALNGLVDHYGYQWWLLTAYEDYRDYAIPEGSYFGLGIYLQRLYIVPAENLVVVRLGNDAGNAGGAWNTLEFLELVLNAIEK